ncbi:hypothetical protein DID88_001769 [Monilinia fructigena]|uniref:Hydrophobin n=1 Tax=Monilinia fructigena TaxID=38457 RepID=A0A395IY82_9HELO|nr:hypothetical protein DID88_001769 [Monilinia fructigena]
MRFIFATTVLSLASVAIAIPTEMGVFARNSVPTCSEGLSIHCCQNAPASSTGLIGSVLDFDCTSVVVQVLLGGILGGESSTCNGGQFACCNISDSPTTGGISILSNDCILQNVSL